MDCNNVVSEKKKVLLAQKESVLQELKYYEKRTKELQNNSLYKYHDAYSSDSEDDLTTLFNTGPSLGQLKLEKTMLKTCLQATQELTGVQVLEFASNIIDEPLSERNTPMTIDGTWREVTVECKTELVLSSIMFYTFTPNKKFAPTWYRKLRVTVCKASYEAELSKSLLPTVKKPSEAIAVLKFYSEATKSRRNTLARLADLYGTSLFMESVAEGGYLLKCENVLEMSWRLENKRSPFLPFQHKMTFELEYMEETYINRITQKYKKLSNPTMSTDERTNLLSEIISICLEAKESLSDSVKSQLERDKRNNEQLRENEVMAPPKTVPKRGKGKASRNGGEEQSARNNNTIDTNESSDGFVNATGRANQNFEPNDLNKTAPKNIRRQDSKPENNVQNIRETSHKAPGKRSRPAENVESIEDTVDNNPKRNKTNEKKLPNKDTGHRNKEIASIKKINTANSKNTQSEKNKKQVNEVTSKNEESEVKSSGHELVEKVSNEINKDVKVGEKIIVASSKNKTPTDAIPANRATKSVNNPKTVNTNKLSHLKINKEQILSSGDIIKRIDNPKYFNNKKPIRPLTIRNNRKSLPKTRKSTGKNVNNNNNNNRKTEKENNGKMSKLPQKLTSHSSGNVKKPKIKIPSNLNSIKNRGKMSNIPRLMRPGK